MQDHYSECNPGNVKSLFLDETKTVEVALESQDFPEGFACYCVDVARFHSGVS